MLQKPINMKNDIMTIRVFLFIITILKNVEFEDGTGRSLTVVGYWWVKAKNLGIVKWNVKSGEMKIKATSKKKKKKKKERNSMGLTEAEDIKKRWQEYTEDLYKKDLHDPDNHDGVIIHLEPDIMECEVKWALGSITMNKASGSDGISAELFQILKDDAVKVLHSVWQQIWKTQQWSQD